MSNSLVTLFLCLLLKCSAEIILIFLSSSGDHEPLFYVQSDEELDVSVDEICTDPDSRVSAHSDASLASTGLISSISSHGSPEPPTFEFSGSSPANETADETENFHETFASADAMNDADGQLDAKMGLLSVEDEQEGKERF